MNHIVQFSGGKDSTCMLLMMLEKGIPIDDIIFCDTTMEFPEMYEHIDKVEKYIGKKITRIYPKHSFLYYFNEYEKQRGKNKGQHGYGWPRPFIRWCTRLLKIAPTGQYMKGKGEYVQYIGIAYDEPKRHKNIRGNTIHPLYEWGITEAQALKYCYDHGFHWNGLYERFARSSCWCCPLQRIGDLRNLYRYYPDLWKRLQKMDDMRPFKFQADYSVKQLSERFEKEVHNNG